LLKVSTNRRPSFWTRPGKDELVLTAVDHWNAMAAGLFAAAPYLWSVATHVLDMTPDETGEAMQNMSKKP
jgi:hypothetical protein